MTTIAQLPEDVLLDIFVRLDCESLRDAALTCRDWRDMIGSSVRTMKKFKLRVSGVRLLKLTDQNLQLLRRHYHVFLSHAKVYKSTVQPELNMREIHHRINVSQVRCFTFTVDAECDDTFNPSAFAEFLSRMPLLEVLETRFTRPFDFHGSLDLRVNIPNLDALRASEHSICSRSILSVIVAHELTVLEIEAFNFRAPKSKGIELRNFVTRCRKMKDLSIPGNFLDGFFEPPQEFPFQLTILQITNICKFSESTSRSFSQFLRSQASLQSLDISGVTEVSLQMLKTIFNDLLLKRLAIDASLPKTLKRYDLRSSTLQVLKFCGFLPNVDAEKIILEKCPDLRKLEMERKFDNVIGFLAEFCPLCSIDNLS